MLIKKVNVSNFKSYDKMELNLGRFNVIIGANASGKSNFVSIFRFLRDLENHGLDNAISMQGGMEHIRNVNIGVSKDFSVELLLGHDPSRRMFISGAEKKPWGVSANELRYALSIEFPKKKRGYRIHEEVLSARVDVLKMRSKNQKTTKEEKIGEGEISITNTRGNLKFSQNPKGLLGARDIFRPYLREGLSPRQSLLEVPVFPVMSFLISSCFSDIAIYDFDPKLSKKAVLITGKTELESDGSNLAITLKSILDSQKKRQKFYDLVKDFLPFLEGASIEKLVDRSLLACFRESYSGKRSLPASLVSDGTINVCALITSLFFERKPFVIFEEPGRNIHPYLISKLIDTMKDVSDRLGKQIIITTHDPQIVRYAGIQNLFLVSRDERGFSEIARPGENDDVKAFLENEIGIDEVYVQGLLK